MQRVPSNDNRRHSSTVTVAVLSATAVDDFELADRDLKIETYKSGGKGGQNSQKNDTAVRITHLPTGEAVSCEQERSQWRNLQIAKSVLGARLADHRSRAQHAERNEHRRDQTGGAERSERSWTWQYQRDQLTHHATGRRWRISRLKHLPPC